jgi:hypothetical protein
MTMNLTADGELELWINEAGRDLLVRELQNLNEKNEHFHLFPVERLIRRRSLTARRTRSFGLVRYCSVPRNGTRSTFPTSLEIEPVAEMALFTIGYERARLADVIAALKIAGVKTLIDVRDRPQSRRPGFSKRQLAAGLEEVGIRYVGLRALGTPPEGREANRRRQWEKFWRIVDDRLATAEAELALDEAAAIAVHSPSCLLCYEADHGICHRSRVADILSVRHGFTLRHLTPADALA